MAISNHERVGRALKFLKEGLYPFIEREMKAVYRTEWQVTAKAYIDVDITLKRGVAEIRHWYRWM